MSIGIVITSLYDQYQNAIVSGSQHQVRMHNARILCYAILPFDNTRPHLDCKIKNELICRDNIDALPVPVRMSWKEYGV